MGRGESSCNRDRNAEVTAGPVFVFMGTRCRYFEKTSITDRMYLYVSLYFERLHVQYITLPNVHEVGHGVGIA